MSRFGRRFAAVTAVAVAFASAVLLSRGQEPAPAGRPRPSRRPGRQFVVAPYLQYPTQTSITVMWETAAPGTSVVEYGPSDRDLQEGRGSRRRSRSTRSN